MPRGRKLNKNPSAAFRALSLRCSAVNFLALAFPPFNPPSLPSATAAAFFLFVATLNSCRKKFPKERLQSPCVLSMIEESKRSKRRQRRRPLTLDPSPIGWAREDFAFVYFC